MKSLVAEAKQKISMPRHTQRLDFVDPDHNKVPHGVDKQDMEEWYNSIEYLRHALGHDILTVVGQYALALREIDEEDNPEELKRLINALCKGEDWNYELIEKKK